MKIDLYFNTSFSTELIKKLAMHLQQLNGHHSLTLSNTNTQTEETEPPPPATLLSSSTSESRLHQLTLLTVEEYQSRGSHHIHIIVK